MIIDLHSHSYYSDGVLSPSELVKLAGACGCEVFALTDHDTTDGLAEAKIAADKHNLRLINGVEVSAIWAGATVHILGLNIDIDNTVLQDGLKQNRDFRKIRAIKMEQGLVAAGVEGIFEHAQGLSKTDLITRTHFAQALIEKGICKDMSAVFKRFLSGTKPGAVSPKWADFTDVISWIHTAGGVAVLAHPFRYRTTRTKTKRIMTALKNAGCDGVEVITSKNNTDETTLGGQWAAELGLLASVGSDYHGLPNQRVEIGRLQKLPQHLEPIWRDWF